jgi:hypothetical protein
MRLVLSIETHLDHAQLAFGEIRQLDLLHSNRLPRSPVERLVDRPKSSLAKALSETLSVRHPSAEILSIHLRTFGLLPPILRPL